MLARDCGDADASPSVSRPVCSEGGHVRVSLRRRRRGREGRARERRVVTGAGERAAFAQRALHLL